MNFNFKEILTATMILFAVIDIVGSLPIIISLREKAGHIQSEMASVIAAVLMIAFLFVGEQILSLIGINVNEFAVAGSLILFFLALEMILGITLFKDDEESNPKLANTSNIIIAIVINIIFIYIVLKTSGKIQHAIGKNGIIIIRKVFGVVLLAIAVKLFTTNIQLLFN